jgi:hypothetical protein
MSLAATPDGMLYVFGGYGGSGEGRMWGKEPVQQETSLLHQLPSLSRPVFAVIHETRRWCALKFDGEGQFHQHLTSI